MLLNFYLHCFSHLIAASGPGTWEIHQTHPGGGLGGRHIIIIIIIIYLFIYFTLQLPFRSTEQNSLSPNKYFTGVFYV